MTNEIRTANDENVGRQVFVLRASSLIRHSSFELRQFLLSSTHPRHVWEAQESAQDFLAWRIFDLSDINCIGQIEAPGFCSSQRL